MFKLKMTTCVWVSYHDDVSEKIARDTFSRFSWAKFIKLPSENNIWFESYAILNDSLLKCEADYIGYISYKSHTKISIDNLDKYISDNKRYDYVALNCGGTNVLCEKCHPNFNKIWTDVISNECPIIGHDVWSNLWVMKRHVLIEYTKWFKNLACRLLEHPLIFTNANWSGLTKDKLIKLTGLPYYSHIPFICERLPYTFCINNGFTVYCLFNGFPSFYSHHPR